MNREQYLKKFSRALRWRIAGSEAEDILSDYGDLLNQSTADESLEKRWGEPYQTARLLTETKAYRRWLAVFSILSAFLLFHMIWVFRSWTYDISNAVMFSCLVIPILLSLFSFRPATKKSEPSKILTYSIKVLSVLVGLITVSAIVWFVVMSVRLPGIQVTTTVGYILDGLEIIGVIAGILGLVQARINDYRWRSVYVLGLTSAILCMSIASVWGNMSLEPFQINLLYINCMMLWMVYAGVGLFGARLCAR